MSSRSNHAGIVEEHIASHERERCPHLVKDMVTPSASEIKKKQTPLCDYVGHISIPQPLPSARHECINIDHNRTHY